MERFRIVRLFRRLFIWLPVPKLLLRLIRFIWLTKKGEDFADISINGELRVVREQVPECGVIFDVGANRGDWAAYAIAENSTASIHCFEPIRSLYQSLAARDFPAGVRCHQLGLSDSSADGQIDTTTTSLHRRKYAADDVAGHTELVQLVTLDEFCTRENILKIDFLKIDVEGHELAVLRGGQKMIAGNNVLRIQFEYSRFNVYSRVFLYDFFDYFQALPFTLYQIMPNRLEPLPEYAPALENFQYKNFLALHDSVTPL